MQATFHLSATVNVLNKTLLGENQFFQGASKNLAWATKKMACGRLPSAYKKRERPLLDRSRQNGAACAKQAVRTVRQAMPSPLSRRRC